MGSCFYASPTSHQKYLASRDSLWNILEDEIAFYYSLGHVVLTGDLNAKTSALPDYVSSDSYQHISLSPKYEVDTPVPRYSCVNNYSKECCVSLVG